ncbi:MAG: peptidyl-prolyl cis-trans isomerase [Algicola sp.]|nr:peptidyl-prolyl cis-trans isomerase [Algicola sp.]
MITITTNLGNIKINLFEDKAPATCKNFMDYVNAEFYNGTIFHRVIDGFMIQGGGFDADMAQKEVNDPVENEANNGVLNNNGTLAMARTPDPHSATAQFFINLKNNDFLNFTSESQQGWGYCVFAEVVEGMDVVAKIKGVETGNHGHHGDVPLDPVTIQSITAE